MASYWNSYATSKTPSTSSPSRTMLLLVLSCSPYLADKAPLWATIIIVALLNINFAIAIFVQVARVHKLFTMHCRGKGLPALWNGAGLLGLQMRQQCLLVAVPEGRGVKLASLAVENMLGQREQVRRNGEVGQVVAPPELSPKMPPYDSVAIGVGSGLSKRERVIAQK